MLSRVRAANQLDRAMAAMEQLDATPTPENAENFLVESAKLDRFKF